MKTRISCPVSHFFFFGRLVTLTAVGTGVVLAQQVQVSTGYDDEPRIGVAFSITSRQPVPWCGSTNTAFYGNTNSALSYDPDEDAILLQNLGSTPVPLTAASIAGYDLFSLDSISGGIPLNPGSFVILAGVDGSDVLSSLLLVSINLTINGTNYSYTDVATPNAPDGVLEGAMPWISGCETIPWTPVYSALTNVVPNIPTLGLVSPVITTNGFNLFLQGPIGSDYEIDGSTNLASPANWQPVLYFCTTNSPFYFTAPAATNSNQIFYRAQIAE